MKMLSKLSFLFSLAGLLWVAPAFAATNPLFLRTGFLSTASSTVTSTLDIYGTTTISNILRVSGNTTLQNVTINGTCSGCLSGQTVADWIKGVTFGSSVLTPSTTIAIWDKSALYVSSTAQIDGALTVNGASSFRNATTTGINTGVLGINGQYFNNLLGTGLSNSAGALTVSLSSFSTTNLSEGTGLYYTSDRWDARFAATSTTGLAEGTRLYYTTDRWDTRFAATTTTGLAEGTRLYWTNDRFDTRFAATSTTGLAEGTRLYWTTDRFDTRLAATTTLKNLTTLTGVTSVGTLGSLTVSGLSTLGGFISSASSSLGGTLSITGATTVSSSLSVSNLSTLTGGFVSGASSTIIGGLNITGANASSTFNGNFLGLSSNNLAITSSTALTNSYFIFGYNTSTFGATLSGSGLGGGGVFTIDQLGNVSASGTLKTYSLTTLSSGFISSASSSIAAGLQVSGPLSVSGTLQVSGNTVLQALTVTSCSGCGGGASPDWVKVVTFATTTLTPSTTISIWGKLALYVSSTLQVDALATFNSGISINSPTVSSTHQGNFLGLSATSGGLTTSTFYISDQFQLGINTSTFRTGIFSVDSAGNASVSGTHKQFGLSTLGGFISTASSSISAGLQVAGALSASGTFQVAGNTVLQALTVTSCSGCLPAADWVNGTTYNVLTMTPSTTKAIWDKSALYVSSTLQVDSLATLNSGLYIGSTSVSSTYQGNFLGLSYTSAGLTTSTFYVSDAFQLGINTSTFKTGVLSVDNAGNLSASGTLKQYGLSTLTGFISTASSSISANLMVAGQLNVSTTMNVSKGTGTTTVNWGDSGKGNGSKVCFNIRNSGGTTSSMYVNTAGTSLVVEAKACL